MKNSQQSNVRGGISGIKSVVANEGVPMCCSTPNFRWKNEWATALTDHGRGFHFLCFIFCISRTDLLPYMCRISMLILSSVILSLIIASSPVAGHTHDEKYVSRWDDMDYHQGRYFQLMNQLVTTTERLRAMKPHLFKPSPEGCDVCVLVSTELFRILKEGGPELKFIEDAMDLVCNVTLKHDPLLVHACEDLVSGMLEILHKLDLYVQQFNFNLTELACADVFQQCKIDCCLTQTTPEQVHISYTGGQAVGSPEMQSSWITHELLGDALVQWRKTSEPNGTGWNFATAESRTYTIAGWSGWIYGAVMTGLEPNTSYTYRVGSPSVANGWSEEFEFMTLPLNAGMSDRPLKIATFADMGVGGDHQATIAELQRLHSMGELDFIVHTGDISYADGDQRRWDRFMRQMQPVVARVPYMTCPGNHEALWNFTAYKQRFFTPATGYGGPKEAMYYTFSAGPMRFVLMDSETWWDTPRMDPVQVDWATRVLNEANEQKQFIYVGFHRPLYCTTPGGYSCNIDQEWMRQRIERQLYDHRVGILHTGHVHNYERSYQVYNGTVVSTSYANTTAPVSLVNGAGGCTEGLESWGDRREFPEWSAKRLMTTAFLRMTVSSEETTHTAQMTFWSSMNATALDSVTITKQRE